MKPINNVLSLPRITIDGPVCGTNTKAQAKGLSYVKGQFLPLFLLPLPSDDSIAKWTNLEKANSAESGHGLELKFNPLPEQSELIKRTIYKVKDLRKKPPQYTVCPRPTTT